MRGTVEPTASGYTGAEVAAQILRQADITNIDIVEHEELLGDHYDPLHKRLVLSRANYRGTAAAALGVAAHECGHAIQHKMAYAPLHIRMAAVGVTPSGAVVAEDIRDLQSWTPHDRRLCRRLGLA